MRWHGKHGRYWVDGRHRVDRRHRRHRLPDEHEHLDVDEHIDQHFHEHVDIHVDIDIHVHVHVHVHDGGVHHDDKVSPHRWRQRIGHVGRFGRLGLPGGWRRRYLTDGSVADVRPATAADIPTMAATMASAFAHDPIFVWMTPERNREARLRRFFTRQLHDTIEHGGLVMSEDGTGAAIWLPPDKWKVPTATVLKATPHAVRVFGARVGRLLGGLATIEKHHPEDPPHWYLEFMATRRDVQRKGVGSKVISFMLDRCDEQGIPAYLEASCPENVPFYLRHGFETLHEITIKGAPNPVWGMLRQPR